MCPSSWWQVTFVCPKYFWQSNFSLFFQVCVPTVFGKLFPRLICCPDHTVEDSQIRPFQKTSEQFSSFIFLFNIQHVSVLWPVPHRRMCLRPRPPPPRSASPHLWQPRPIHHPRKPDSEFWRKILISCKGWSSVAPWQLWETVSRRWHENACLEFHKWDSCVKKSRNDSCNPQCRSVMLYADPCSKL